MYTFESRVRYSEIGEDRKMTLNSILNYFQDCSTFHSESVGRGMDVLTDNGRAWLLAAWQVCVNRYPGLGENIIIGTKAYEFRGFIGNRNFQMTTPEGEMLAYANSMWTYYDVKKGVPARVKAEEMAAYEMEEKLDMEYAPRKITLPGEMMTEEAFTVKKHHLDTNHHVNNAQYVRMAQDYIPGDFCIHQLRVEYKAQAVLDDVIVPKVAVQDGVYTVALDNENGRPYAVVEVK